VLWLLDLGKNHTKLGLTVTQCTIRMGLAAILLLIDGTLLPTWLGFNSICIERVFIPNIFVI
jgi:hypothetical protein